MFSCKSSLKAGFSPSLSLWIEAGGFLNYLVLLLTGLFVLRWKREQRRGKKLDVCHKSCRWVWGGSTSMSLYCQSLRRCRKPYPSCVNSPVWVCPDSVHLVPVSWAGTNMQTSAPAAACSHLLHRIVMLSSNYALKVQMCVSSSAPPPLPPCSL